MRIKPWVCLGLLLLLLSSCSGGDSTSEDSSSDASQDSSGDQPFIIQLPFAESEQALNAYGIWPFGVHGSLHAYDGHPGLDFELALGSSVLAAQTGTIQSITQDGDFNGRNTIQIQHQAGSKSYRTIYTNIQSLAIGIAAGAKVAQGQALGSAGSQSLTRNGSQITYAMTHFQVDDFSKSYGLSNQSAFAPDGFLENSQTSRLNSFWKKAAYNQEICEPFLSNDRGLTAYPTLVRTWTRSTGSHAAQIKFTCTTSSSSLPAYQLLDGSGKSLETGSLRTITALPGSNSQMEWLSSGQEVRKVLFDLVDGQMSLDYSDLGGSMPTSLGNASNYSSTR